MFRILAALLHLCAVGYTIYFLGHVIRLILVLPTISRNLNILKINVSLPKTFIESITE